MFKRLITMITITAMFAALFAGCAPANGTADSTGKVYNPVDFEGSAGEGILPLAVNSKGELTAASQKDNGPVIIAAYDTSGKKTGEITTDITDTAMNFTLDGKDQAYILTMSQEDKGTVHVLDASGKTVKTIPLGDILKDLPTLGGKIFNNGKQGVKGQQSNSQAEPQTSGGQQTSGQAEPQVSGEPQTDGDQPQRDAMMIASSIQGFTASSDGNIYISVMGSGVVQADGTGKLVRTYNSNMMNLIAMDEKEQLIVFSEGQMTPTVTIYDTKSGSEVSKHDALLNNPNKIFYDKTSKELYYMNNFGILPVKEDGTTGDALFSLNDISLDSSSRGISGFVIDGAGSVYISSGDNNAGRGMISVNSGGGSFSFTSSKADRIDKAALVDASSVPQKKILTVAGISGNNMLNTAIAAFQKAYPDYKVEVKTYENQIVGAKQAQQPIDVGGLVQQFNTDIISGNSADVYILDDLPYYKYIDKGILADLGQMMAADNMDTSAYFSNIFDACKVNGKLYSIPVAFTYDVLAGKAADMPSSQTPTVDEFFQKAYALPAGTSAFPRDDALDAFASIMQSSYSYFVDQTNRTARFDSSEFIKIIKDFKAIADSKTSTTDWERANPYELIAEGKLAYTVEHLRHIEDLSMIKAIAGDSAVFTDMPSMEQGKYGFTTRGLFGINDSSQNKQAAWNLIKILLSEEIQSNMQMNGGFPVNRAANASRIEELKNVGTMGKDGARLVIGTEKGQYEAKPLSDAEYAAITSTFGKLNTLSAPDPNIIKILEEELPSFFLGQKSAEDTAALIQNRVQTILNE